MAKKTIESVEIILSDAGCIDTLGNYLRFCASVLNMRKAFNCFVAFKILRKLVCYFYLKLLLPKITIINVLIVLQINKLLIS